MQFCEACVAGVLLVMAVLGANDGGGGGGAGACLAVKVISGGTAFKAGFTPGLWRSGDGGGGCGSVGGGDEKHVPPRPMKVRFVVFCVVTKKKERGSEGGEGSSISSYISAALLVPLTLGIITGGASGWARPEMAPQSPSAPRHKTID